jgi:hypothetical protein
LSALAIASIVLVCVFSATLIGLIAHERLPVDHFDADSKDVVKLVIGLVATLSALVLGLLVAAAKNTYDTQRGHVAQLSADLIQVDRTLARYGPEAKEARVSLRQTAIEGMERVWPKNEAATANLESPMGKGSIDGFYLVIENLSPQTDVQRAAKSDAQQIATDAAHERLLMTAQLGGSIPTPFLVVLVSWLALLFGGFGLLTKRNATVVTALFIGSLSVAGAIFLILELDSPYGGLMGISEAPLQRALAQIGQ